MVSTFGILCVILSLHCCFSWHCAEDVDLATTSEVEYDVNTRPYLNPAVAYWVTNGDSPWSADPDGKRYRAVQPRVKENKPKHYWGTKMNFYWFGTITAADSLIIAGMYNPDNEDMLVYGAVINCATKSWMTVYQNSSMASQSMWKKGDLKEECKVGEIFDLIFEMSQMYRGSFIFNGQPLEDAIYPKLKKNARNIDEITGSYTVQRLPVALTLGTKIKGSITGGNFDRYAYGKCYAFPHAYLNDCTGAKAWITARNKIESLGLISFNEKNWEAKAAYKFPGDETVLGSLGMNNKESTVSCLELPEGSYFHYKQDGVHPDQNTDTYLTSCCSYMNGTLADDTCESYKNGQYMQCKSYMMWYTKYEGLEAYYVGDLSEDAALDKILLMTEIMTTFTESLMATHEAPEEE